MHEFEVVATLIYLVMFSAGAITHMRQLQQAVALFADRTNFGIPASCGIIMDTCKIYISIEDFLMHPNPRIMDPYITGYFDSTVTYTELNFVAIPVSNFTYKIFLINNLQIEKNRFLID